MFRLHYDMEYTEFPAIERLPGRVISSITKAKKIYLFSTSRCMDPGIAEQYV